MCSLVDTIADLLTTLLTVRLPYLALLLASLGKAVNANFQTGTLCGRLAQSSVPLRRLPGKKICIAGIAKVGRVPANALRVTSIAFFMSLKMNGNTN